MKNHWSWYGKWSSLLKVQYRVNNVLFLYKAFFYQSSNDIVHSYDQNVGIDLHVYVKLYLCMYVVMFMYMYCTFIQ